MNKLPLTKQTWTIAKIEMRRAFFSRRAFWVYGLALFPTIIFLGHFLNVKFQRIRLSATEITPPALLDSLREGETEEAVRQRLGKAPTDYNWERRRRIRDSEDTSGITTHRIEPAVEARYIRLNIYRPTHTGDNSARIAEFEVYGGNDAVNLAWNRPADGSASCSEAEGPEKAFDGNPQDYWCSSAGNKYLQVDLGEAFPISRIVLKHASAAGKPEELNTATFNIQASRDDKRFETVVNMTGARLVDEITRSRRMVYFDGKREAVLDFTDGKLVNKNIRLLLNFEEDRSIFAGVFQHFYLRLAIFFGCLGIFMNLFRGEVLDKTLHFWFLAPAKREVLLIGKYGAGLIAASIIFAGGALLCFAVLMGFHDSMEVQAYLGSAGIRHAFWYITASVMGCIGYGSVFLAAGLLLRNPIIPAAVLLGWESINSFLPEFLQKLSVLHYLQSLCPVPIPMDDSAPGLLRLLLVPAAPASRIGAIAGLILLTAFLLWIAAIAIRRMEVSYSTE
ncbi:MAG: discoidin domain-containing protein [Acidobacteria bacterium]|nr:discoidin domain-containing protein [Acidobacteriota bacterium]